jgi:acetyl esterase/lipase
MSRFLRGLGIVLLALILWLAITDNINVWPARNTVEYHVARGWWNMVGEPQRIHTGSLAGLVTDSRNTPIAQAVVLIAEWDGSTHSSLTDDQGKYRIDGIPAGFYRVAASAASYDSVQSGGILRGVTVRPKIITESSFKLAKTTVRALPQLGQPTLTDPQELVCKSPVAGAARRETLQFGQKDFTERIYLYRPTETLNRSLPVLLTVYPGPVDTWECVSTSLAQAGYAVLAVGPAYGLDLTRDVEGLQQLMTVVKAGGLPGLDNSRIAALGGSYSALLLELLMLRDPGLEAVILLGPPTDMFDFRRRFEREGFMPPFGLDRALIALGLPSRDPLRYLHHSMVYHVRENLPATLLFHSYQDEIVPYQQSGLLADSLRKRGVEAELHLFDGASHYLLEDSAASMTIYEQTLEFLRRHGMAPLPGKGNSTR